MGRLQPALRPHDFLIIDGGVGVGLAYEGPGPPYYYFFQQFEERDPDLVVGDISPSVQKKSVKVADAGPEK